MFKVCSSCSCEASCQSAVNIYNKHVYYKRKLSVFIHHTKPPPLPLPLFILIHTCAKRTIFGQCTLTFCIHHLIFYIYYRMALAILSKKFWRLSASLSSMIDNFAIASCRPYVWRRATIQFYLYLCWFIQNEWRWKLNKMIGDEL